jgi:hypothetical protein
VNVFLFRVVCAYCILSLFIYFRRAVGLSMTVGSRPIFDCKQKHFRGLCMIFRGERHGDELRLKILLNVKQVEDMFYFVETPHMHCVRPSPFQLSPLKCCIMTCTDLLLFLSGRSNIESFHSGTMPAKIQCAKKALLLAVTVRVLRPRSRPL